MTYLADFLELQGAEQYGQCGELQVSILGTPDNPVRLDESYDCVQQLVAHLTHLTADSFGTPLNEDSGDGTKQHLSGASALAILHNNEEALGFASGLFPREGHMYLHGIALSSKAKGQRAAARLVGALRDRSALSTVAFTTQNPVMYCLAKSFSSSLWPNPLENIPDHFQEQAVRLMSEREGVFNPVTGVSRGLYAQCLYERIPSCTDVDISSWFERQLNIKDGQSNDGFLFVGNF